jgi:hypothetical protein
MSNLSVFWQIPQFILIGISEILASITSLEFFYSQSPTAMRSVMQSFNLLTFALGSFILIPLIYLVNSNPNNEWITQNLNDGHLSYYFLVLAALMIVDLLWFAWLGKNYEYKKTVELQVEEADFKLDGVSLPIVKEGTSQSQSQSQSETSKASPRKSINTQGGSLIAPRFMADIDPHTGVRVMQMDPMSEEISEQALHNYYSFMNIYL